MIGGSETKTTVECLRNRKSKRDWSVSGERLYGVQVGEEKWRGTDLLKKVKLFAI